MSKPLPIKPNRGGWKREDEYTLYTRECGCYDGNVTEYRKGFEVIKVRYNGFWVDSEGGVEITLNAGTRYRRRLGIMSTAQARTLLRANFGIRYTP